MRGIIGKWTNKYSINQKAMKQAVIRKVSCLAMLIMLLAGWHNRLAAQTAIVIDSPFVRGTTVVIPGKEYRRSGWHNFFWGKHYRKEWNTAFRAENFYIDTALGGLVPTREGGGRQSKNLRLKAKNSKEYVLRSVNKDFSRGLDNMDGTFVSRVAKDQVSIGHPYAAVTITPMIKATGIYHTTPRIVFVPKQKALGQFNNEYGDQLYLFEQRPDENQEDADNFGNAKNVVGSDKLFEKLWDENDNYIDQPAFAKARLFDMFIGDWGRHPDNWRWAEFDLGKQTIYRPVPRDRDQAYTKIDGFYPNIFGSVRYFKHLQGFNYSIKNVGAWNFPGRPLDYRFLNELHVEDWVAEARDLQGELTDSLIERSVRLMPPELFRISGETIIAKLKSRRDDLQQYARDYYKYLAKTVTILGSEKTEKIEIEVLPDKKVEIEVFKINKQGNIMDTPYYFRRFDAGETKDIYLYGLGKQDIISIKGERKNKIGIHIIDPQDKDSVFVQGDNRQIKGIKFFRGEKFEYDTIRDEKIDIDVVPILTPAVYSVFERDPLDLLPRTGIKIKAGVVFTPQPWRKRQYQIVHSLHGFYGFLRKSFNVGYVGRYGYMFGKWDMVMKARMDNPAVENYFGTGNNTVLENKERNFYRTESNRIYAGIGLERNFYNTHHVEMTMIYQSIKYRQMPGHFISNGIHMDPSIYQKKHFAGMEANYIYDHTRGDICPRSGFVINIGGGFLRNLSDTGYTVAKLNSHIAAYLPLSKKFTFAVRVGGATAFGEPDFYHLNRLGGNVQLRGYDRERFYGKNIAYANTEIRWITNTKNYFFNGRAGLVGFYDIGRVWMPGEKSNKWHPGYGGGVVIIPFNKITLSSMYGVTPEGDNLIFLASLFF